MLRIVAGRLGGRRLIVPRDSATRPTSERVREALFSILGSIEGNVLDLYAGSGALGFEALSRGASRVVFVESRRHALHALWENACSLGVETAISLIPRPVERASPRGPFSLILADPPYALVENGQAPRTLVALLASGILAPGGVLVLEHAARTPPPALGGLFLRECRCYGDTALSIHDAPLSQ
ncbi:MAG: 16S rRNA (guanine(966)-N(2))-methyltransferase RsmD [Myxococcales bacterium]|nr:16S rRNA (guanine(966)-N(2))-methyltransferase RsmD [Polyangiaceae bacterium]MDW8250457.1 16S rRNA (guanine(966)-N(2))-methyltransferase RsmD [Myxococcales bacterium]